MGIGKQVYIERPVYELHCKSMATRVCLGMVLVVGRAETLKLKANVRLQKQKQSTGGG